MSCFAHVWFRLWPKIRSMSERSIYLRDQANKCLWHANHISDPETEGELRKLATEYIERAAEIEGAESVAIPAPPSLWPFQTPDAEPQPGVLAVSTPGGLV
jgi:hypothetical protein